MLHLLRYKNSRPSGAGSVALTVPPRLTTTMWMRSSHLCQPLTGLSRSPYLVRVEPFWVTLMGGFRPSTPDGDSQSLIPTPCQYDNGLLVPVKAIRVLLYWSHYKGGFFRVNHHPTHTGTTIRIRASLLKTTHKGERSCHGNL